MFHSSAKLPMIFRAKTLDSIAEFRQFPVMDSDEREIYHFLKSWGNEFIAPREICRRASGKKRFHDDPEWAKPVLLRMSERGILESNSTGHYRIRPVKKKKEQTRWVSPDIVKILKESGVEVEDTGSGLGADDYYDQL
jgi:hypothetical protein